MEQTEWSDKPTAILIMGKQARRKRENKQLLGRVAMATALWYGAPQPKPYLMYLASDSHAGRQDAELVKQWLIERFHIPADYLIIRCKVNCTLLEVLLTRVLARVYGLSHVFAVTHLYHSARTQWYFDEYLDNVSVIPTHHEIFDEISYLPMQTDLFVELRQDVMASLPSRLERWREEMVEFLLTYLHHIDRQGHVERFLATTLR
ncbi:ElyC/SanA/YdcF family protein [Anaerolineales bacterium HSG6]|nr:ElyC/SanA/YdcF family protein [Anaerolineales bacterium HSG6]